MLVFTPAKLASHHIHPLRGPEIMQRFMDKAKYDWERLSNVKKGIYGVVLLAAVTFLILSVTGTVNLFDPTT